MLGYTCILLCFLDSFVSSSLTQPDILHSLGNHGDRLSDLESKMAAFTATVGSLQSDLQRILKDNSALKQEIASLKSGSLCTCTNGIVSTQTKVGSSTTTSAQPLSTTSSSTTKPAASVSTAAVTVSSTMLSLNMSTPLPAFVSSTACHNVSTVGAMSPSTTAPSTTAASTTAPSTNAPSTTSTEKTTVAETIYTDCDDAWSKGLRTNRALRIQPTGMPNSIHVYCYMTSTDGWIVIQRRINGNVSFERGWLEYKRGFGDFYGDFWIGNEMIHQLTARNKHSTLYISLEDWSFRKKWAQYSDFWIGSESEDYRLNVGTYSGNAGDSFNYDQSLQLTHNHMPFSTEDNDNDPHWLNCAQKLHGGWWFNRCYSSNLNGRYLSQPYQYHRLGETFGDPTLDGTGIEWYPWQRQQYSLKFAEMMIKIRN